MKLGAAIWRRVFSGGVLVASGAVLLLAAWLEPSPLGHSTHTQLGLGQCTFLTLTGVPCPMCGMTTTFALMAHGRPFAALRTQPFGVLLFSATAGVFGVAIAETLAPRDRWARLLDWIAPWEGRLAALFLFGMGSGWLYKIASMSGFLG
jgi:hypothetical protein